MDYSTAKAYVIRRLSLGGTTVSRLSRQLARRGATPDVIEQLMAEMTAAGYLSDTAYGASVVNRTTARGYGPAALVGKLLSRGVPMTMAQSLVREHCSPEVEAEALAKLLSQSRYRVLPRPKLLATLQRRGFSYDAINAAIAGIEWNEGEE
jgi:regulatory protein